MQIKSQSILETRTTLPVAHLSFHRSSLSSSHRVAAAAAVIAAVTVAAAAAAAVERRANSLLLGDNVRVKDTIAFFDALCRSNLSELRVWANIVSSCVMV